MGYAHYNPRMSRVHGNESGKAHDRNATYQSVPKSNFFIFNPMSGSTRADYCWMVRKFTATHYYGFTTIDAINAIDTLSSGGVLQWQVHDEKC